ncbi:MAG TPA: purine-nucleoside phosphorylase [Cyanobacteria bacterium UBA8530]|nr:purine-nucleoside phosphorylase [Cyanobacteria bacterium UBA8530]
MEANFSDFFDSSRLPLRPEFGIVLGSGIVVLEDLEDRFDVSYGRIQGLPKTTVAGHQGVLSFGRIPGGPVVLIARGRFHLYEGHPLEHSTCIVRLFEKIGLRKLILTNAAGGLKAGWWPGDLMLIRDHLNLQFPRHEGEGQRNVYDQAWGDQVMRDAAFAGVSMRAGVYAGLLGPTYETPAEVRWLQKTGADAVGMSTVPEANLAASLGMKVLAISCITNVAVSPDAQASTCHEEVVDVAKKASQALDAVLHVACRS